MLAGDLNDRWMLRAADRTLLGNKGGATRLGFAVLLKLFQADGRFPPPRQGRAGRHGGGHRGTPRRA